MNIFEENITPLEKIIPKTMDNLTLKETVSLIFHASHILAMDLDFSENYKWQSFYEEFEKDLKEQNRRKWPKLIIVKNDYSKRIDIFSTGLHYVITDNLLSILFRLLYIENYKRKYIYKSYNYHNILGHKLSNQPDKLVSKISLEELFNLLKYQLKYYLKVYDDADHYENCLGGKLQALM